MRRLTISLEDALADEFDKVADSSGYRTRSEAFRDLLRRELEQRRLQTGAAAFCVANLCYVYDHHKRKLSSRLAAIQHEHHDIIMATTHVHMDHDNCIETVLLRGPTKEVVHLAEAIIAETGVRHGKVHLVPIDMEFGRGKPGHPHVHFHPKT